MAIIKHIPVRSMNYNDALNYVLFQHDELTGKVILDDNGNKIMRDEFYLTGINVNPLMYAQECSALNKKYHKNQSVKDIKSHHYIISFDPEDMTECGLTGKRAQELGTEFAKKYFPGFQTLVCTHTDGHNGSGNIHVHIMFNSVRKLDVEPEDFLERPIDCKAGYKHHETKAYMTTLKQAVMDMCEREGLHQVDLLSPAAVHINDKEYHAARKGQKRLERKNQKIIEDGLTPRTTTFQTQKQFIRDAIEKASQATNSFEDFCDYLEDHYSIRVSESRGRISYLHPDKNKPITGRALGTNYEKEYLLKIFDEKQELLEKCTTPEVSAKADKNAEKKDGYDYHAHEQHKFDPSYDYASKPFTVLYIRSELRLVVNLQSCIKAQQNKYYAQKVKISNLQQMAKAIVYAEANGFDTIEALKNANSTASQNLSSKQSELQTAKENVKQLNLQIRFLGRYYAGKKTYQAMLKSPNIKQFRREHEKEIAMYLETRTFLQKEFGQNTFPNINALKAKKEALTSQIKNMETELQALKSEANELNIVCANVDALLSDGPAAKPVRKQEHSL